MNCFAFNRMKQQCTCLNRKKCIGFNKCVFFKEATQARREAVNGLYKSSPYWKATEEIIDMIDDNQREHA